MQRGVWWVQNLNEQLDKRRCLLNAFGVNPQGPVKIRLWDDDTYYTVFMSNMRQYENELGRPHGQPQFVNRRLSADILLTHQCKYPAFATVEMLFRREKTNLYIEYTKRSFTLRNVPHCITQWWREIEDNSTNLGGSTGRGGTAARAPKTEILDPGLPIDSCWFQMMT